MTRLPSGPAHVYWNDQFIGTITDAVWSDYPWAHGTFKPGELSVEQREGLGWLVRVAESNNFAEELSPGHEAFLDGWTLREAGGETTEISPPLVDFEAGSAEWR
jgi:hypothetical protein